MCGIAGVINLDKDHPVEKNVVKKMADQIIHRGPDDSAAYVDNNVGFGFRRLSIIDIDNGIQPFFNHDRSIILVCNGEIFNYKELRSEVEQKGHKLRTNCDVEIIVPLYMEYGIDCIKKLNGQFAFAIFDKNTNQLMLGRDHFGICPLFFSKNEESLVFASEIKSILEVPKFSREIGMTGLDQIFSFPANIAPATLFKHIHSLEAGHFAILKEGELTSHEYWNLDYPDVDEHEPVKDEAYYVERLDELLLNSVKSRLIADVPVGFYLSGGLDSSLIGGMMHKFQEEDPYKSFSICFSENEEDKAINEQRFQRMMSNHINSDHHEIEFSWDNFGSKLKDVIYYSESPLKETYNICSMALSKRARQEDVKVVLCGEGADELFGGYAGYKFDGQNRKHPKTMKDLQQIRKDELSKKLWGDTDFVYEKDEYEFRETKSALYSSQVNAVYSDFDCLNRPAVDHERMKNKHIFHQRSYVDFKLRLGGHLIADHGDRMTMANSIEGRYPFLDVNLIEFTRQIPPEMMVKGMTEKYILKKLGERYVPKEIFNREKFGFVAPGSPQLLKSGNEWIHDFLSYDMIKRQGYFNPDTIERLKKIYSRDNFILNPPYDIDLLIIVLTFNIFLQVFEAPSR
ncbi:MAG: asparagine synthase (glutamine-hydrolyzing) [Cyclobacteriaceae bacterium]